MFKTLLTKLDTQLKNSRFWILTAGIVLSVNMAGFIQLYIPSGSLQTIRIEQFFGYTSMLLLYLALIVSPLLKVFPNLPGNAAYKHARRAIGVLAFYYAFLHSCITFFGQLDGFTGIKYLDKEYIEALLTGMIALGILFILAATSLDWAVRVIKFKNWKLLHRLVYIAGIAILIHVMIVGPNYAGPDPVSGTTAIALVLLLLLEAIRFYHSIIKWQAACQKERA